MERRAREGRAAGQREPLPSREPSAQHTVGGTFPLLGAGRGEEVNVGLTSLESRA